MDTAGDRGCAGRDDVERRVKVFVLAEYFDYEGWGEPISAHRSLDAAMARAEQLGHRNSCVIAFEMDTQTGEVIEHEVA
jgi:hypothetical protein